MLIRPEDLKNDLDRLEDIERATIRLVFQAINDFKSDAVTIFRCEKDLVGDIGEDITREALDRIGTSRIVQRLFGKMDYKKARYVFHPDYAIKQALFVDSKAEKEDGEGTATLQMSQMSMEVRQMRAGKEERHSGELPCIILSDFLTTTIFVKYSYIAIPGNGVLRNELRKIIIAALPNGMLQEKYNPDCNDTIFRAGRNAPSRNEAFRVRLKFDELKNKADWRVQVIDISQDDNTETTA